MSLNIVFCWPDISGYMAACWRALTENSDLKLFVIAFQAKTETAFADQLMADIPCRLLNLSERNDSNLIQSLVLQQQPDILVLPGWFHTPYRHLATLPQLQSIPLVMGMDTPWQGTIKQRLAPYILGRLLRRMARVVVTGERSWQYARRLVTPSIIRRGLYGVDTATLAPLWADRQATWPQRFLFMGRYAPVKGLDTLINAYQRYRQHSTNPWPLVCCGQGPLAHSLLHQPGIIDCGFLQPPQLLAQLGQTGALVLPSHFDPWPLALVEAAAAGLPIICTDACGSAVEIVRSGYNGRMVPPQDVESLAQALWAIEQNHPQLPTWGLRSQQLAAPFSAQAWADRWHDMCFDLVTPAVY